MNTALEQMLSNYHAENIYDKKNAVKEIIQEIVLCGLSRAGFFKKAAFYGGTALRIFYGLDRFSEDLDFSLIKADPDFNLSEYFQVLESEVRAFGLNVEITQKAKTKQSNIRSAFVKGNTLEHFLLFYDDADEGGIAKSETIKIKLEIDVNPPDFASFERKYRLLPSPYEVNMYDMPSLFAGKIHAVLARAWKSRVKGRDLYDYVFYLSQGTKVNLRHLQQRLIDSGYLKETESCAIEDVRKMLCNRFDSIDYAQAKQDVLPFISDGSSLDIWSSDFFKQITQNLDAVEG
jgi:predicted nucleotidyltransferase component of viral defense system